MAQEMVFNTGDTPLVIDEEGRVLGGYEWGTADTDTPIVAAFLASGQMTVIAAPDAGQPVNPLAQTALDRLDEIEQRAVDIEAIDKDDLILQLEQQAPQLLAPLTLGGDDKPSKADLVAVFRDHLELFLPGQPGSYIPPSPSNDSTPSDDPGVIAPPPSDDPPVLTELDVPVAAVENVDPAPVEPEADPQTPQDDTAADNRKKTSRRGTGSQKQED